MKPGAVLVDVAIDQGGCFETSHATTHDDPVFEVDGIVHYCVANMPGAVPITSTKALTNVTLPYVEAIADKGVARAIAEDRGAREGRQRRRRQDHVRGGRRRRTACRTRRSQTRSARLVLRPPARPSDGRIVGPQPLSGLGVRFAGEILTTAP